METQQPQTPARRSSLLTALLAIGLLAGTTAVVLFYHHYEQQKEVSPVNPNGFDFSEIPTDTRSKSSAQSGPGSQQQSGLSMIKGSIGKTPGGAQAPGQIERTVTDICRANEPWVQSIARQYTQRYPVIAQFGRDWMAYPDLKRLNDGYMLHHDPIAFMRGATQSHNFGIMAKKYATQPEVQAFVKDVVSRAPKEALGVAMDYLKDDKNVAILVNSLAQSMGFPPGLLNLNGSSPQIDQQAILNAVLQNNPQLQNQ